MLRNARWLLYARNFYLSILVVTLIGTAVTRHLNQAAHFLYQAQHSAVITDRNSELISLAQNSKGHYVIKTDTLPESFTDLLLKKEDRWFYYHPGVNPISSLRGLYYRLTTGRSGGSSTLTQQLAKNLLGTETERNLKNKFKELGYALSLELFNSKNDILTMYANSVYLGNQVQGFETASRAYFDKPLQETTTDEQLTLLATLSYPTTRNPWAKDSVAAATALQTNILPTHTYFAPVVTDTFHFQAPARFEISEQNITCTDRCQSSVDTEVSEAIRALMRDVIKKENRRGVRHGAVVVIDPKTSELIAMVGSPDPDSQAPGYQVNLATSPRPVGSTIKAFIYLEGMEAGLRPYTLVEDREYKYPIATGFSLYPKNYDGQYHGEMTLHEALSNSFNTPAVKVLEYVGLENFYHFLDTDLQFSPIQPYESYQYGIALGGLEIDLLTLTHYFTVFPNKGVLKPLQIVDGETHLNPQSAIAEETKVAETPYVELINAMLSDRLRGVNQFGLVSNLNVPGMHYAVKTGTSRDFHDSWVVGFSPDFVVGVWLGNAENEPLEQVTGQSGAGALWQQVMQYLATTPYHTGADFSFEYVTQHEIGGTLEWGLPDDDIAYHQALMQGNDLILEPHSNDRFELTSKLDIPLRARRAVTWTVNGRPLGGAGQQTVFSPTESGTYELMAVDKDSGQREIIFITVTDGQ